jgi:hypothetical protein
MVLDRLRPPSQAVSRLQDPLTEEHPGRLLLHPAPQIPTQQEVADLDGRRDSVSRDLQVTGVGALRPPPSGGRTLSSASTRDTIYRIHFQAFVSHALLSLHYHSSEQERSDQICYALHAPFPSDAGDRQSLHITVFFWRLLAWIKERIVPATTETIISIPTVISTVETVGGERTLNTP